jgi:hypothetical protein
VPLCKAPLRIVLKRFGQNSTQVCLEWAHLVPQLPLAREAGENRHQQNLTQMLDLMVLMISLTENGLLTQEDWHNRCDIVARQGLVASPKYLLGESLYLPSDPPAQKARGVADRESRLDPVPSLLLWACLYVY